MIGDEIEVPLKNGSVEQLGLVVSLRVVVGCKHVTHTEGFVDCRKHSGCEFRSVIGEKSCRWPVDEYQFVEEAFRHR